MTIPIGRRRLVLSLISSPAPRRAPEIPVAVGATDAELARLGRLAPELEREHWRAVTLLESARLH